jgi:Protein of Unknown function (DUF2784)
MKWSLLADGVVVIHFAFTTFVIFGGFLTRVWPRVLFVHLPALAWGVWVEVSTTICPLTPLENHLRHLAGESGYSGGFLAHYLTAVLYPPGLTWHIQWVLAALVLGLNAVAYGSFFKRSRASRTRIP